MHATHVNTGDHMVRQMGPYGSNTWTPFLLTQSVCSLVPACSLDSFWLTDSNWCWFIVREKHCWMAGWFWPISSSKQGVPWSTVPTSSCHSATSSKHFKSSQQHKGTRCYLSHLGLPHWIWSLSAFCHTEYCKLCHWITAVSECESCSVKIAL
jgi:hypothetical protein